MADLFGDVPITAREKRVEVEREIGMRKAVYPRLVREGRMTNDRANRSIAIMRAIAADYEKPDLAGELAQTLDDYLHAIHPKSQEVCAARARDVLARFKGEA